MKLRIVRRTGTVNVRNCALGAVLVGLATVGIACGSGGPGPSPAPTTNTMLGGQSTHAIHVLAKLPDGTSKQLDFGPGTELHLGKTQTTAVPMGVATGEDAGTLIIPPSVEAPIMDPWSTAWALVWRAAVQCGGDVAGLPPWYWDWDPGSAWYLYETNGLQSCSGRLLTEQNLVCVADKLGAVADAVGTVVWPALDAQPGTYNYGGGTDPVGGLTVAEWDIPPQADSDRFIVRDLAIHTLAMIPTLDAYTDIVFPSSTTLTQPATCTQAFAWLANPANTPATGCIPASLTAPIFGDENGATYGETDGGTGYLTPYFPPSATPICDANGDNNAPAIAATAVDINAQILRSAGRLLHDLIRRDVYSDMAAASQQAAQALDPVAGNMAEWGQPDGGTALYGTISHAARVLVGRWEVGEQADFGTVADPRCENQPEIDILPGAFGSDYSARYMDRSIRTSGEQTAVQLVERSGIVLPSCAIPDLADGGAVASAAPLRSALIAQLALQEQVQNNLPSPPPETALQEVLSPSNVADAELIFAFQRALRTWRLMTNTQDTTAPGSAPDGGTPACTGSPLETSGALPAGLLLATYPASWPAPLGGSPLIASSVASLSGVVVEGGLSRSRLVTDPMARAGGMTEASQCSDSTGYWDEWGTDDTASLVAGESGNTTTGGLAEPPVAALPTSVFQDAFSIGQALERRLNVLQTASGTLPALSDPINVSRGGIAELRSWAGATIVHAWPVGTGTTLATMKTSSMVVRVGGMSYAHDFGTTSSNLAPVEAAFGFVYGPPWMAECAAGLRADCPANFAQTYVQLATAATDMASTYVATGVLDNVFELTVPLTGALSAAPLQVFGGNPSESHIYMVRLHDPSSAMGQGRVLGTLPLRGIWRGTVIGATLIERLIPYTVGFVDAPMQRELIHDAIDLGKWVGARPPALGDPSAAESSGYCVDGVPRNLFVPLDNELVSGTQTYEDSWQAYLSLAQQAAQTADTLGQQLIANDLQISQNQQAAEEQLANICGDFAALSTATVGTDGTVTADPADQTTSACISEPTTDVVFLGGMQGIPTTNQTCAIKLLLNCPAGDLPSGCSPSTSATGTTAPSALALCTKTTLTASALNITPTVASSSGTATVTSSGVPVLGAPGSCPDLMKTVAPSIRTGFHAQQFLVDAEDPALSANALMAAASQLQLDVDMNDNWQVTYGSQIIMSTYSESYWPGCLLASNCTATTGLTAVMAPVWSAVFRDCANPNVGLGGCDGGGIGAELNMLKWRVTQALWMIDASAGIVPPNMFNQPLPGVFTDWDGPNAAGLAYFPTSSVAWYLGTLSNGGLSSSDPNTSIGDIQRIGTVTPVGSLFGSFESSVDSEVPYWYRDLYSAPYTQRTAIMGHFAASNDAAVFTQCPGPFASPPCPASPQSVQISLSSLIARANNMEGLVCTKNFAEMSGRTVSDTQTGNPWWYTVAAVKQGLDRTVPALSAGVSSGPVTWDPSATPLNGSLPVWPQPETLNPLPGPFSWPGWGDAWGGAPYTYSLNNNPGWAMSPIQSPTSWPPSQRAFTFAGLGVTPNGTCGAATLLLQAAALACTPNNSAVDLSKVSLNTPPQVQHLTDLPVLEAWLALAQTALTKGVGQVYAQTIPTRVVTDFASGTVGSGNLGGTQGQSILTMEQQLQAFPAAWAAIASDLGSINSALQVTGGAITAAGLNEQTTDGQLALSTIQTQGAMTQAIGQFMVTVANAAGASVDDFGASTAVIPAAAVQLAFAILTANQEMGVLTSLQNTASQVESNQVDQALAQLNVTTGPLWADVQKQIDSLRGAVAQVDASAQAIVQSQNQAAYQLAVGTGSDFVSIAGQEVPIPVDTVLRRQSSATLQRYQAALTNAKALAYMARRAIEQRIGVPMSALTQQVGPVDAPASWADDICSLQGVNYSSLSTATQAGDDGGGVGGTADQQAISQFANAWVGDYVAKLQNFVTYYNVQYPSHQGEDTAILSLRYDLLGPSAQCTTQAPNLLTNSGDLSQFSSASWQITPCDEASQKCLAVVSGEALPAPQGGPWDESLGAGVDAGALLPSALGVTWLLDVPEKPDAGVTADAGASSDAGASAASEGGVIFDGGVLTAEDAAAPASASGTASWPNNLVAQQVSLAAGSYVLSWWDQARNASGNIVWAGAATPPSYIAEVLDPSWSAVVAFDQPPYMPPAVGDGGGPSLWSARHTLSFTVTNAGMYTVAFGASTLSEGPGSVGIANVQLEQATSGQPSTYVGTTSTTMVAGLDCPMSDSDLRAAFTHSCDPSGACHYDLAVPFIIDTSALDGTPLSAKLANGNYNYRQVTTALNMVGTNVHSCANDPSPDCYGSGYVQYSLQHDASNAGIVGYDGNSRVFDFGVASVNNGKALAAEQYITMPLSTNDQNLISQPGIEHIEFGGRPVDGTYYLRIWDSPDLNWSALQDVQLILDYEYWSQIQTTSDDVRHPQRLKRGPRRPFIKPSPRR